MICSELNHLIRSTIKKIIDEYSNVYGVKNKIIRAIMGSQGAPATNKWLDEEDTIYDFGVKPLSRIASSAGYQLHLVFIKDTDVNSREYLEQLNYKFVDNLTLLLEQYIQHPENLPSKTTESKVVSQVVSELLEII